MRTIWVDPNSISRMDPTLTVADLSDANGPVQVGDRVWAALEDPEGGGESPRQYRAEVVEVLPGANLVWLKVEWSR